MVRFKLAFLFAGVVGVFAGCGSDDPEAPDAGPQVDAGPEPISVGEVYVGEVIDRGWDGAPSRRFGSAWARVRTGAEPRWHQEVASDGTCRLLKFTPAQCDEYCQDGVCVTHNVCQPYPKHVLVGALTITGLTGGDLELVPAGGLNWYFPEDALPGELFADDATVGVEATGSDDLPAFSTRVRAVAPLVAEVQGFVITLVDSEDHVVKWTPAGDPEARVRITFNANNQGHGMPYAAILECDAADGAGEIRVPKAMIAAFPETDDWQACAGSDCPRSWMRRYRRAYASVPGGGVRLDVGSEIDFGVEHH